MGFFGKKEKRHCPICGSEMGVFSMKVIADSEICENCEKMIRGQFDIEEYWQRKWGTNGTHREDYRLKTADPLGAMTLEEVREMIALKKQQQAQVAEQYGSAYSNLARVESTFTIAPKALDVGLKRAKELKGRVVATCLMVSGELKKGDEVTLKVSDGDIQTRILDVILCSDHTTFETELSANMGKHRAEAGVNAWILLDVTIEPEAGSVIGC